MENKNHSCIGTVQILQDSSNSSLQWMANLHESVQAELQKICLAIAEIVETDAIYSLDYCDTRNIINTGVFINKDQKKHLHFFLVVFVKKKLKYGLKLHKRIKQVMEQNISTTLLIHTTSSLQTVEKEQRNFFYQLFKQANVAYQCQEVQPLLNTLEMPESKYDNCRIYMYVRNAAALDYLEALKTLEKNGDTMPCAVLMHLAVEHICLLLIHSHLGYIPNKFSTKYLFELVDYSTALAKEIFPRNTPHEIGLFKILCTRPGRLRAGYIDQILFTDIQTLAKRCREFQSRAFKIAQTKIELLKI